MNEFTYKIYEYERYLIDLGTYDNLVTSEAYQILLLRDFIQEKWHELSDNQQREVERIDTLLRNKSELIGEILPIDAAFAVAQKRLGHWWWFLNEESELRQLSGGKNKQEFARKGQNNK